jgi:oligopeptide/dipeptide ABC transporter ATP-binding protein
VTAVLPAAGADAPPSTDEVLRAEDLSVRFRGRGGDVTAVDHVSLAVRRGEVHGIVGESGCGKSTFLRALLGLLPPRSVEVDGTVRLEDEQGSHPARPGRDVAMVFQDPSTALNPVVPIGRQLRDGPARHLGMGRGEATAWAVELLRRVGVPDPERRMGSYAHELSGGLRQRVMIAVALSTRPRFLLCDEPTTALDVTVQDQVLGLIDEVRREQGLGVVFVSHDLAVVASLCSTVSVMYAGRVVEEGPTTEVFADPTHPYTRGLLASVPDVFADRGRLEGIPGAPPDLADLPTGCAFAPRCPDVQDRCRVAPPVLRRTAKERSHACLVAQVPGDEA